jgi:hypothetical protein
MRLLENVVYILSRTIDYASYSLQLGLLECALVNAYIVHRGRGLQT